jgi:prepilin peptidase CpaA
MSHLALIAISIYIIVRDILTHRISNLSILLLSALLLLSPHPTHVGTAFIAIATSTMLFHLAKIGMGDLKLLIALLITQGALVISANYLNLCIVVLVVTLISQLIWWRSLRGSVAFAHVLLLPFVIVYLAI